MLFISSLVNLSRLKETDGFTWIDDVLDGMCVPFVRVLVCVLVRVLVCVLVLVRVCVCMCVFLCCVCVCLPVYVHIPYNYH